jgi:murein DD-endopeptidase MepM/ murein hydrolase activator NlpD
MSDTTSPVSRRNSLPALRLLSSGLALAVVVATIWLTHSDWNTPPSAAVAIPPTPILSATSATGGGLPAISLQGDGAGDTPGQVVREAVLTTTIPVRPSYAISSYTVTQGDSLFSIAINFKLKPDTILWGNPGLAENPNILSVGKTLNILPVDGALRVVMQDDTLERIAKVFHVKIDDITGFPGNELDSLDPQIYAGQVLVIPHGWREQVEWQAPRPQGGRAVKGRGWGAGQPGACAGPFSGANGTGTFDWPARAHYLSGFNFGDNGGAHQGIDIAASQGSLIYAADSGVIIFAGWNTWGYGNMIMIDHGNGWQTLYGHLSQINVTCGQSVYQGNLIGLSGNTGNSFGAHLHFEMQNDNLGRVNPWNYLTK